MDGLYSAKGKYWYQRYLDEDFVRQIKLNLDVKEYLARILSNRVDSIEAGYNFLDPKIKHLMDDPYHIHDMAKGVKRFLHAISANEKICIIGDYDVDGATSSALIKNFLKDLGYYNVEIYIPDRIIEGYGPSRNIIKKLQEDGVNLIITVDCGVTAFDALEYAYEINLDVIVIDHHMSIDVLPKAVAVINPNRLDQESNNKNLAAVGVSFLFLTAVLKELKNTKSYEDRELPNILEYLDIVALGTVCDVMLLTGLNRAFVKQGLKVGNHSKNIGYRALKNIVSIDRELECYHLGFILGPRINAGGRVGNSSYGAKLLTTDSVGEAKNIAIQLDKYNEERKLIEDGALKKVEELVLEQLDNNVLFVAQENLHPGIIGIVAGNIKEKYNKPTVIISLNNDEGKASCRSVSGLDIGNIVIEAKNRDLLIAGGGHAMAAGFTVAIDKLDALYSFMNEHIGMILADSTKHLTEYYDLEVVARSINREFINEINKLAPFGNGNPNPIIRISNLYVVSAKIIGTSSIKLILSHDRSSVNPGYSLKAIAFKTVGTPLENIVFSKKKHKISIFGYPKIDIWNNIEYIQFHIRDIFVES